MNKPYKDDSCFKCGSYNNEKVYCNECTKQIIIQFLQKVENTDDLVTLIVLLKQGSINQLKAFVDKIIGGKE